MRRFATSLFLVILASLIFYGGAGVNFVSYCCGVCEKEGVEALLELSAVRFMDMIIVVISLRIIRWSVAA